MLDQHYMNLKTFSYLDIVSGGLEQRNSLQSEIFHLVHFVRGLLIWMSSKK